MAGPCAKRDVLCVILSADHKKSVILQPEQKQLILPEGVTL